MKLELKKTDIALLINLNYTKNQKMKHPNYQIIMLGVSKKKTDVEYFIQLFKDVDNNESELGEWKYREILQEKEDPNNGTKVYTLLFERKK